MKIRISTADALTVIDGQGDFVLPTGALYVSGIPGEANNENIIKYIIALNTLPFGFRTSSEDEHVPGHIEYQIYGGEHCPKGKPGQKYISELVDFYKRCDQNLVKGDNPDIIAYSIATSRDFQNHIAQLRKKGIKRIFVVGWAYTHCVGESAIAYATQGFEVYVVRDATRSVAPPYGDAEVMKKKLALYGVKETFMADLEIEAL